MNVIKRDGTLQEVDRNKIKEALRKAFEACDLKVSEETLFEISSEVVCWDEITIEDIQDQIEELLMDFDFPLVAKAYILYRKERELKRQHALKDIQFIHNFVQSSNAANATIDDNSNIGTKGIGVLNAEIHKEDNKDTNMEWWESYVKQRDPDFDIKIMRNDFNTIMYPHDSSSQVGEVYCMSASLYPMLSDGLAKLGGKSTTPKSLESFCGIYINLNFALASEIKGAVATPEFLMYFDYFARKEWGNDYYTKSDAIITSNFCKKQKTIKQQIEQYFQQVTYSINQIAGSRGMQSPLKNLNLHFSSC